MYDGQLLMKFIVSFVLLLLATVSADARGFPRGSFLAPASTSSNGSPNVTIMSGSIAGSIVDSRTGDGSTFQPPFFVQVSASGITGTGTSAPYEDLSYSWRFLENGVVVCGETFTRPTDGATVCPSNNQAGPEAVYVKRTAGTLTAELTVTGSNGTCNSAGICNGVTPYIVTKSWTVSAWSPAQTFYFDPTAGGTNAGTLANPFNSMASLNSQIIATPTNTQVYFALGTHYSGSVGLNICSDFADAALTGVRFGTAAGFGSGANPIIDVSSGTTPALSLKTGGLSSNCNQSDVVFSNIDFVNSGSPAGAVAIGTPGNATNTMKNIYVENSNIALNYDTRPSYVAVVSLPLPPDSSTTYLASNMGLWNVTITNPTNTTKVSMAVQGSAQNWFFHIAGALSGAGEDSTGDHHIYNDIKTHGLYQWVTCGPTGTGAGKRNLCFNGNWDGYLFDPTNHQIAQYISYLENSCRYTSLCVDLGNRSNNTNASDSTVQFQYAVIAGNALIGMAGPEQWGNGLSVTMRDNRDWGAIGVGNGSGFFGPPNNQISGYTQGANLLSKIYRNKTYMPSTADTGNIINYPTNGNPWSSPQFITYNTTVDARTSGELIGVPFSDMISAGSKIDFNVYSSIPVDTTSWWDNTAGTTKTFAQWQAAGTSPNRWDANGINLAGATPSGWTLPVTQWSHMGP